MFNPNRFDQIKLAAGKKILQSGRALNFLERQIMRGLTQKPPDRVLAQFGIDLVKKLYADKESKIVWTNAFFPSELLWGLGLTPFFPEIGAAASAAIGLADGAIERATASHYAIDLCTFHRAAAGLTLEGIFPRADAFISTAHLCDVAGQNLANHAYAAQRKFFFVDIPTSTDDAAVDYVEKQLTATARELCDAVGVRCDAEGIYRAVHLSNLAWDAAQEQLALRAARPAPLRGSEMISQIGLTVMLFGTTFGVDYYRALCDYIRERVATQTPEQLRQNVRLYWMHLRPYFGTELMAHLEDDLGAVIAFEEMSSIWWERLDEQQPFRALARKMLANFCVGLVERRIEKALAHIARYECDGAVHFSHWGCRQSTGALRVICDRFKREGIPFLQIDGDCIDSSNLQMGPLRTRVEAFVETLV
jgi:benzoyl-CoA reductase/2-hydroxyglutaryl-CoA dehydratase subunit BcrC/BadD/HgdB